MLVEYSGNFLFVMKVPSIPFIELCESLYYECCNHESTQSWSTTMRQ